MDKFGVFNILNSLFALSEKNSSNEKTNQSPLNLDKILSSLMPKTPQAQTQKEAPLQEKRQFAPLQASMLATMQSHEQFVKRVKERSIT